MSPHRKASLNTYLRVSSTLIKGDEAPHCQAHEEGNLHMLLMKDAVISTDSSIPWEKFIPALPLVDNTVPFDNFIPVIPVDEIIHTADHPFCDDMTCDCHEDPTLIGGLNGYHERGEITTQDADQIYRGQKSLLARRGVCPCH